MNKTPSLIAAAVLAFTTGVAMAQPATPATDAPRPRGTLDANGDGVVDRAEAAAHPRLAKRFDALDANGDDRLDRNELRHHRHAHHGRRGPGARRVLQLDTDGDGRISKAEAAADERFAARFGRMDIDSDGFIDRADRQAAAGKRRDAWFAAADADGNGSLSKAEYDAAHASSAAARKARHAHRGRPGRGPDAAGDRPAQ